MSEIQFLEYCFKKLTVPEFAVFSVARAMPLREIFPITQVAQIMDCSDRNLYRYFKSLEKKGFLIYNIVGCGRQLEWVRRSPDETIPGYLKRTSIEYQIEHPDLGRKTLRQGAIAAFVRRHKLCYTSFRLVLNGEQPEHKGWKLSPRNHRRKAG